MANDKPFKAGATDPFMGYVAPGEEALEAWVPEHLRSGGMATITDADYSPLIFGGGSSDDQSNPLWMMDDLVNPNFGEGLIIDEDETEEEVIEPAEAQSSKVGAAEGTDAQENTTQPPKPQTPKQDNKSKKPATPAQYCETCNAEIPSRRAHWARRCHKYDPDGLLRRGDDPMLFQMG